MDKLLKKLFSYQEFENDKNLLKLKEETEAKYNSLLLNDDDLAYAYGGTNTNYQSGQIVNYKVGNEIKTGKIVQVNNNQVLIEDFGWISISQICQ